MLPPYICHKKILMQSMSKVMQIRDISVRHIARDMFDFLIAPFIMNTDCASLNMVLCEASEQARLNLIQYAIWLGADVHANYDSAIKVAAACGHCEIVKYLVSVGANPRIDDNYAIRVARANKHTKTVRFLTQITQKPSHKFIIKRRRGPARIDALSKKNWAQPSAPFIPIIRNSV
jgi:hypothetical protein